MPSCTRTSRVLACNTEKLGVAWGRGYKRYSLSTFETNSNFALMLDGSAQVYLIDSGTRVVYGNAIRVHSNAFSLVVARSQTKRAIFKAKGTIGLREKTCRVVSSRLELIKGTSNSISHKKKYPIQGVFQNPITCIVNIHVHVEPV